MQFKSYPFVYALGAAFTVLAVQSLSAAPTPVVIFAADTAGSTNGAQITTWHNSAPGADTTYDASPPSRDNAPTLVTNGQNGLPLVHFNATQGQYLTFERPVQDDFSIVVVFRSKQGYGDGTMYFQGAGLVQGEIGGVVSDFGLALNDLGQVDGGTGWPDVSTASARGYNDGNLHIAVLTRVKKTGFITLSVDDGSSSAVTGGTQALVAPSRLGIGALNIGGLFLDGDIAQIEIFDVALTDPDRHVIETALKQKWIIN